MTSKAEVARLDADEFLALLEEKGMFEGNEAARAQLQKLAGRGIHPLEILSQEPAQEKALDTILNCCDADGVAKYMLGHKCQNIVVMCGAGISTAAGIPDFRTPGSGLYDNLQRFNLPKPQAVFDLDFFRESPGAFYELAKEMWPGNYEPTTTHYFIRLLSDKGVLLRCYTQNIDSLERQAGLPAAHLVAAHGNFDAAHVIDTNPQQEVEPEILKAAIDEGEAGWRALCEKKGNLVKPNIVFFGEELPKRFGQLSRGDFWTCDLLLVLGTSLVVQPFAGLLSQVCRTAPRVLVNRDPVGTCDKVEAGFRFLLEESQNWRDSWLQGDCDDLCRALAAALGWEEDLDALVRTKGAAKVCRASWATNEFPDLNFTGAASH